MKRSGKVVEITRELPHEGTRCIVRVRLSSTDALGDEVNEGLVSLRLHESDARRYPIGRAVDVTIAPRKERGR